MEQDGVISTRGLKPDAVKYGELIFDVNSAYFYNHGGYEFAKQFYADAYKAAVEIAGGEQYILSAVTLPFLTACWQVLGFLLTFWQAHKPLPHLCSHQEPLQI